MAKRKRTLYRRIVLIGIAVAFVGAVGFVVLEIYKTGLEREDLFEKARSAMRVERYDDAVTYAREALASEPSHHAARQLLVKALLAAGRTEEVRAEIDELAEHESTRAYASRVLCDLALRERDYAGAERIARSLVDDDPDYAYRVLALIQDFYGIVNNDWRKRLEAAHLQRGLASVATGNAERAEALIFASSITMEVATYLENAEGLVQRVNEDLESAVAAVDRARQEAEAYRHELAMGRIRILSADETEAAFGAETLRKYTRGIERDELAIAELAKHHVWREEWTEALELVRQLENPYHWMRVFWMLRRAPDHDVALQALDAGPLPEGAERELLRADLLLAADEETARSRGRAVLEGIVKDPGSETSLVLQALVSLAMRTDLETARKVAETAEVKDRDDPRITAFLASLLSAEETDKERGLALAQELAKGDEESQAAVLRTFLSGGDAAAMESYLDERIRQGGESGFQARLTRAFTMMARRGRAGETEAAGLRRKVLEDLQAIARNERATKPSLVLAFNFASSLGERELAGRMIGRAAALPGAPEALDARIIRFTMDLGNEDVARELAAGVRQAAAGSPAGDYLEVFAGAIETRASDLPAIRARLEEVAATEGPSRRPALELAARIALGDGQLDEAERLSREARKLAPESVGLLELVGSVLLRRGRHAEVLDLYGEGEDLPEVGYYQTVGALLGLERRDEALERAKRALDAFPRSIPAHLVLAQVHIDRGERLKALSVLNIAPTNPYVAHLRAELLTEHEDFGMAKQLYEALLLNSRYTDIQAWRGLLDVLIRMQRESEFITRSGSIILSNRLEGAPEVLAALHYWRGQALERGGKLEEATAEYEASLRIDGTNWRALNNAAWLVATTAPLRIPDARAYIDRALELRPDDASVIDTAAEVYSAQGEGDAALGFIDKALSLVGGSEIEALRAKVDKYTVHKARILERMDRDDEAKVLLERVVENDPDSDAAIAARSVLWKIEQKHMPVEPEEEADGAVDVEDREPGPNGDKG